MVWSVSPAWEAVELTLGDLLHLLFVVLDPTDLGATIVVAPGQMPDGFLPSPTQIACLF